jgi:hypothetical protein
LIRLDEELATEGNGCGIRRKEAQGTSIKSIFDGEKQTHRSHHKIEVLKAGADGATTIRVMELNHQRRSVSCTHLSISPWTSLTISLQFPLPTA